MADYSPPRLCVVCGYFGPDCELVGDGTDSGEKDWLCPACCRKPWNEIGEDSRIIYRVTVPLSAKTLCDDTPDEYRVEVPPNAHVACIIYGRYGKRWHANVSARWLVRHLIDKGR